MKYSRIIKAINEGIDRALMSFNDEEQDFDKSSKIKTKTAEYIVYLEKAKKLLSGFASFTKDTYNWFLTLYLDNGFLYQVLDRRELETIILKCVNAAGDKCNLNWLDVSNIKNMINLFLYCMKFNGDISEWDVSNVTNMFGIFAYTKFNGNISLWNVSNVTNMGKMFYYSNFNGDISEWDVRNVTNGWYMFDECPIKEEYKPKFKQS